MAADFEFSFVRGNYLILAIFWVPMDFAGEMPSLYYEPFVIYDLGSTATILGMIGSVQSARARPDATSDVIRMKMQ